jgi:prepilin-type N-terminal cleavage/methylation domain-containing protein
MVLKKNTQSIRRGFTLLELLVVVMIIGIISTIVLTGMGNTRTEKQVDAAGREVAGSLRELQQYSLTGKQFVSNTNPCLYSIAWNTGSSNYTLNYRYQNSTSGACDQQTQIAVYTMKGGVVFSNSGSVGFQLPHGRPNFAGASVGFQLSKSTTMGVACLYADGLTKSLIGSHSCP